MKKRVLVVEDDPVLTRVLCDNLTFEGFDVQATGDGAQAEQIARDFGPDLVLLDVNLPDQNGYEVCRELKMKEALRRVPVIFLSADDDPAAKARALEAGGDEYLVKPFDATEVLARIALQLRLARALLANEQLRAEVAEWKRRALGRSDPQ